MLNMPEINKNLYVVQDGTVYKLIVIAHYKEFYLVEGPGSLVWKVNGRTNLLVKDPTIKLFSSLEDTALLVEECQIQKDKELLKKKNPYYLLREILDILTG